VADLRVITGAAGLVAWLAAGPVSGAATHRVTIEGMKFAPAALTVQRGDTIVWENRDMVPHTATARGTFDSGPIAAGKSWRYVGSKPGRYEVVCTLHPTMKATLVVE
jgi:plastocyanin